MSRPFGSKATLNGKPVVWGGDDYGWQSPGSFEKVPKPGPMRMAGDAIQGFFSNLTGGRADATPTRPVGGSFQGPGGDPTGSGLGQAQQNPAPIDPRQKAVSDTLSYAEGTWNEKTRSPNYGMRYGDKKGEATLDISKPHPLDVRSSAYGSPYRSNASGAFQFLDNTWVEMNDGVNAVMSPQNQDRAVGRLIGSTGYDFDKDFGSQAHLLSGRWASIPNKQGKSQYGQPVHYSADELNSFYLDRRQELEEAERMRVYQGR